MVRIGDWVLTDDWVEWEEGLGGVATCLFASRWWVFICDQKKNILSRVTLMAQDKSKCVTA